MNKIRNKAELGAKGRRGGPRATERVATPFGLVTPGCYAVEDMDDETLATVERGLRAAVAATPAERARRRAR